MFVALFWGDVEPTWRNEHYDALGYRMFESASAMPGCVALHKLDVPDGRELAIAYFETEEQMRAWYDHPEHRAVETLGRREVLRDYTIEVCEVKRAYTKETSFFRATPLEERAADALAVDPRADLGALDVES